MTASDWLKMMWPDFGFANFRCRKLTFTYVFKHGRCHMNMIVKIIGAYTGCPQINFTFLNVNNVRTYIRIATPAVYIDRRDL